MVSGIHLLCCDGRRTEREGRGRERSRRKREITVIAIDVFKKHKLRRKLDCLKEMENNKGKQRNLG